MDDWTRDMIISDGHPTNLNFSALAREQIVSPFQLPPQPEVVYYQVRQPRMLCVDDLCGDSVEYVY
jgi:hypothetical protein